MNGEELLSPEQIASELSVTSRTVRGWCKAGRIPAIRVGGQWRIPRSWLEMKLKADTAEAVNTPA